MNEPIEYQLTKLNKCIGKIRKMPLAEAPTASGKLCSVERRYLSHYRKTAYPRKISLKSDNRLLGYGHKRFSIWRPSAILN